MVKIKEKFTKFRKTIRKTQIKEHTIILIGFVVVIALLIILGQVLTQTEQEEEEMNESLNVSTNITKHINNQTFAQKINYTASEEDLKECPQCFGLDNQTQLNYS